MLLRKDVIRPGVYLPADGEPRKVTQEEINRWVENHKKLTEKGYHVPLFMTHPRQDERHSWPVKSEHLEELKNDPWFIGTVKGYAVDRDGVLQVEYDEENEERAKKLTAKNAAVSPQFGPWIDPDDPSSKWDGIIGHIAVTKRPVNKNQKDRFEAVVEKTLAFGLPDHVCVFGLDDAVPSQFSFNEADHPREPGGSSKGGRFARKSSAVVHHSNLDGHILERLSSGSATLSDFRESTGHKKFDKSNPLANPVHKTLRYLVDSKRVRMIESKSGFGEPSFEITDDGKKHLESMPDPKPVTTGTSHPSSVVATYEDASGRTRFYRIAQHKGPEGTRYYGVYDNGEGTDEHDVSTQTYEHPTGAKMDLAEHLGRLRGHEDVQIDDEELGEHHAELKAAAEREKQREQRAEEEQKKRQEQARKDQNDVNAGFNAFDAGKFKKQTVQLATVKKGDKLEVDAHVQGNFAVHKNGGGKGYGLTHIPTGMSMSMGVVDKLDHAKRFAALANASGDWSGSDPKKFSKETMSNGAAIAKAMRTDDYRHIAHLIGGEAKSLATQMGEDEMPTKATKEKVQQFALFPVDDKQGKTKKSPTSKKPKSGTLPQNSDNQSGQLPQDDPEDEVEDDDTDESENEDQESDDGDEGEDLELGGNVAKKASELVTELLKNLPGEKVLAALAGLLQSVQTSSDGDGDADDKKGPDSLESAPITVQMGDDAMAGEADKTVDKTKELETKVQQFGTENANLKRQVLELKSNEHARTKAGILADLTACESGGQISKVDADGIRAAINTVQFSEDDKHVSTTQTLAEKVNWHKSLPKGTFWSDAEKVQQFGIKEHDISKGGFFAPENDRELSAEEVEAACKAFQSNDYDALDAVGKK